MAHSHVQKQKEHSLKEQQERNGESNIKWGIRKFFEKWNKRTFSEIVTGEESNKKIDMK